jgi:hypothetical protein
VLGGCDQTVRRAEQKIEDPSPRPCRRTASGNNFRPAQLVTKRWVIAGREVGERALSTIEDALDAGGARYEQQLPMLGVGGELSDEERADRSGVKSIKTAEIDDHTLGASLESILKTIGEAVQGPTAEISVELDSDRVPPGGDAYLKSSGPG